MERRPSPAAGVAAGAIKAARIGPGAAIGTESGGIAASGSFTSQSNFKLF